MFRQVEMKVRFDKSVCVCVCVMSVFVVNISQFKHVSLCIVLHEAGPCWTKTMNRS